MVKVNGSPSIRLIVALLAVLVSWTMRIDLGWSYAPVDDLIAQVDQLRQAGEISDITTAANLIVSLQTIGTTIDAGDRPTAKQLLDAFNQEVGALSGVTMTSVAADQLIAAATSITNSL